MRFELWKFAVVAAVVVLSVIVYRGTYPPVSPLRRTLLLACRIAAFLLLGMLLVNPVLVSTSIETKKPVVLALLDHSRSMGIRDAGGATRLDAASDALGRLRGALGRDSRLDLVTIPFSLALSAAPVPADTALTADGEGTDIWGALERAERAYRSSNVAAIILLSDGRVTRGVTTTGGGITVPVYAVGFGDTLEGADIAVDEVICDRFAYRGTRVPVEAVIAAAGVRGASLEVRLLEGDELKDRKVGAVGKDRETISVPLTYVPDKEGEHRLTVEVLPAAGERQRENNLEQFRIEVLKNKIRILYIDQLPDWNMAFVRSLVQRAKRLEMAEVTWTPNSGFTIDPGSRSWTFPSNAGEFAAYDLVIVSDDMRLFDARRNAEVLADYVRGGGGVLFIADENSPLARASSFALLQPLLPVRAAGRPRVEYIESFARPSPDAAGDPASELFGEGGAEALPPLTGRIAEVTPTAGASVPIRLEDGKKTLPFLVISRSGEGLASVILGFPLWRWQLAGGEGQRIYESFLGGLVQYLAEGAKTPGFALEADRTVYRMGDRITLVACVGERRSPEGVRGEIRRKGSGDDAPERTAMFEPDPRRNGCYRAELEPLSPGEYVAAASEVTRVGGGLTGATSFSVVPTSVEFLRTSRDAAFLAGIAEATGGAYLDATGLAGLPSRLRYTEQAVERRDVRELRGSMLMFIGVVVLLAAEWILRKTWGLV